MSAEVDNLVIGGGLAGAMTALRLAAAGREVLLLEKESKAHHKVCGEFLSPEAVEYLRQAGVDPIALGAAPIHSLRLSAKNRSIETPLPFQALSLSRCILDAALLARAEDAGCMVRRGVSARRLSHTHEGWRVEHADGTQQSARAVFLATGKHDLRGWNRPSGVQGDMVGFKLHWRLAPAEAAALRGFIDLFLFSGGYGGLSLVEGGAANLCLVVRRSHLRKTGGWPELLAALRKQNPHLAQRLAGAESLWDRPLAIASIPYGFIARRECGVWLVGDQAAVIPSFTGDGMAIALHSGALAAGMYLAGASAEEYQQRLCGQLNQGIGLATWLSRAMVSFAGSELATLSLATLPGAMRWIAASTRIPAGALLRSTPA